MRALWPVLVRGITTRRTRALLTVIAVALGVAVMVGVQVGESGLDAQARAAADERAGASGLDVRATRDGGLTNDQIDLVSRAPGLAEIVPLYQKRVTARPGADTGQGVTVNVVGAHQGGVALRPADVVDGRLPDPASHDEVAVDRDLLQALSPGGGRPLRIGDALWLTTSRGDDRYRVVGVVATGTTTPGFARDSVVLPEYALRGAFDVGLRVPVLALRLQPGADPATVAAAVRSALGGDATTYDPHADATRPTAQIVPLLILVTALSLAVGAGVSANSVSLSALERRREVGLLRAAGASARDVFRLFVVEAALLATAGAIVGALAGLGAGALLQSRFANPDLPPPPLSVSPWVVVALAVLGVLAAALGAAAPALGASRLNILEAIRPLPIGRRERISPWLVVAIPWAVLVALAAAIAGSGGVAIAGLALLGLVAVLLPLIAPPLAAFLASLVAPVWPETAMAAANLRRRRNRTGLTVAGLMVSMAAAVASAVLIAGALGASDSWVSRLLVGDTLVHSPVTQPDGIAAAIAKDAGLDPSRDITTVRTFSAEVGGDVIGLSAIDANAYRDSGGLAVETPDRDTAFRSLVSQPAVLVPASLADATGWEPGTDVQVTTPRGSVYFRVTGLVDHSFPAPDGRETLVVDRAVAQSYFGATAAGFDDLLVRTPGHGDGIASAARRYGLSATPVADIVAAAREALSRTLGVLVAIAVIAIGISLLAVVNTLAVTIRQGARELALLRAVGLSRRQGLRLLLAEATLMSLTAAIIGIGAGFLLALMLLSASAGPGFNPSFSVPLPLILALIAAVVAAALVAALLPARRAVGASIVAAIHSE